MDSPRHNSGPPPAPNNAPADALALRNFIGTPAEFWPAYLDFLCKKCQAEVGVLAVKNAGIGQSWQAITVAPADKKSHFLIGIFLEWLSHRDILAGTTAVVDIWISGDRFVVALPILTGRSQDLCYAGFILPSGTARPNAERFEKLLLLADVPASYNTVRLLQEAKGQVENLAGILDLSSLINNEKHFLAAAMVVCNEIAGRHQCQQVSLGWLEKHYVRLKAISHRDHFEAKMDQVKMLEAVVEEALDQNTEIVMPHDNSGRHIVRDHEAYQKSQKLPFLCTVPLRLNDVPVAGFVLERTTGAFTSQELALIHMECDGISRRMADLKDNDRWIGFVAWHRFLSVLARWQENRKEFWRYLWIGAGCLVILMALIPFPYQVHAPVIVRTDNVAYLTAPTDGHIAAVNVRPGDDVVTGQVLLQLDKDELQLESSSLEAEISRYQRETEKVRAQDDLATMRMAQAMVDQTTAKRGLVQYRLSQMDIKSPFDGIIVEGDLKERIGSIVRQGENLFRVARSGKIYVELNVPESEIQHLKFAVDGQVILASRPQDMRRVKVIRIEPVAIANDKGNYFVVHAALLSETPSWWRPGMTGVGKLRGGYKTLLWMWTHKTLDFLLVKFWW